MQKDRLNLRVLSMPYLLQISNRDLQLRAPAHEVKCGGIELGRSEMALRSIRGSYTLARNPHKVAIQFPVRILVVEDRNCVGAWSDAEGPSGVARHFEWQRKSRFFLRRKPQRKTALCGFPPVCRKPCNRTE